MKLSLEPRIWISGDYSNPASEIFATKKSICSKPKPSQIFTLPRLREQKSQVDCKLVQKHGSIFLRERTFDSIHWKLINYLIIAGFKSQKYTCAHFGKINHNWSSSIDLLTSKSQCQELDTGTKPWNDILMQIDFWLFNFHWVLTPDWARADWAAVGDDKAPIRMHQAAQAAASASHSHIWDISGGRGSHPANQRPSSGHTANQTPDNSPHRVIGDSDKSKQTNSQSNAVCDV